MVVRINARSVSLLKKHTLFTVRFSDSVQNYFSRLTLMFHRYYNSRVWLIYAIISRNADEWTYNYYTTRLNFALFINKIPWPPWGTSSPGPGCPSSLPPAPPEIEGDDWETSYYTTLHGKRRHCYTNLPLAFGKRKISTVSHYRTLMAYVNLLYITRHLLVNVDHRCLLLLTNAGCSLRPLQTPGSHYITVHYAFSETSLSPHHTTSLLTTLNCRCRSITKASWSSTPERAAAATDEGPADAAAGAPVMSEISFSIVKRQSFIVASFVFHKLYNSQVRAAYLNFPKSSI